MFKTVLKALGIDGISSSIPTIPPFDVHENMKSGTNTLIDVREPDEWKATGSPEGSLQIALQGPDFLSKVLAAVENDKDRPVIVCCRSGMRGEKAGQILKSAGFTDIRNVEGGTIQWLSDKLPMN